MQNRGFQLIESLIVFCLVSALGCYGLAGLWEINEQYALELAMHSVSSEASAARVTAISRNLAVSLVVDSEGRRYALTRLGLPPKVYRTLPRGVTFLKWPSSPVTFYSRGNAVPGGTYVLENSRGRVKIVIAVSGRVRWERIG